MKGSNDIDMNNSLQYREGWHESGISKYTRPERTVFLSELPDGTLAGTEKMTRSDYAKAQRRARMALGWAGQGLYFSESAPAVAYRAKVGMLKSEKQYGRWVVWEEAGPRRVAERRPPYFDLPPKD